MKKTKENLLIGHKLNIRDDESQQDIEKKLLKVVRDIITASKFYTGYRLEITVNSYWDDPKDKDSPI